MRLGCLSLMPCTPWGWAKLGACAARDRSALATSLQPAGCSLRVPLETCTAAADLLARWAAGSANAVPACQPSLTNTLDRSSGPTCWPSGVSIRMRAGRRQWLLAQQRAERGRLPYHDGLFSMAGAGCSRYPRRGEALRAKCSCCAGDQTAHLLYRIQNGELPKKHQPKVSRQALAGSAGQEAGVGRAVRLCAGAAAACPPSANWRNQSSPAPLSDAAHCHPDRHK